MSPFQPRFAQRNQHVNPSAIRELLKVVQQPDIISFAGGMPAPELFPRAELEAAAQAVLSDATLARQALQYGLSEGYAPLRHRLVDMLAEEGIKTTFERVLITTGSQQAIDMIAKLLLDPGDQVVVSAPTFLGALQSFNSYQARYLPVPLDEQGMRTDVLAEVLAVHRPKLIYVIPNFQNPTGVSMTDARKRELYALARQHGVPVLEDDPYGDLYFGPERPLALKALDEDEGVLLLRTFSKVLAPGLRIGYAVLPPSVMGPIMPLKQSADLHSTALAQMMIDEYLKTDALAGHLDTLRTVYRQRRDWMLAAMAREFPSDVRWTVPDGGLFIWVTLPEGISAEQLLSEAIGHKVAFVPGAPFYTDNGGKNTFRLNFSMATEAQINEGIHRLGTLLHQALPKTTVEA